MSIAVNKYRRRKIRRLRQQLSKAQAERETLEIVAAILQNLNLAWKTEGRKIRLDDQWITVHGGSGDYYDPGSGVPVLIDDTGRVKGGAGGKLNGKVFANAKGSAGKSASESHSSASKLSEGSKLAHATRHGIITFHSKDFGKPGVYSIFRTGAINDKGMLFFSAQKEKADSYISTHGLRKYTHEFEIPIKNPLNIKGRDDVDILRKEWEALHPGKDYSTVRGKGEMTFAKWKKIDGQNAAALKKSEYDAVITYYGDKPAEIHIPASRRNELSQVASYTATAWSRAGYTYKEAVETGFWGSDLPDYEKLEKMSTPSDYEYEL